ncbi:hypothetical protein V2J09_006364 [Rumex salicifolius]
MATKQLFQIAARRIVSPVRGGRSYGGLPQGQSATASQQLIDKEYQFSAHKPCVCRSASTMDANCGNTLLISLEELVKDGLLLKTEMVDFSSVAKIKDPLVAKASRRLITSEGELREQYDEFCRDPDIMSWLEDASYVAAVDDTIDSFSWYHWPSPLKDRHLINTFIAQQFLFQRQWKRVRDYAKKKGVKIMGDMPIYVGYHSADVWDNRSQFLLNKKGYPLLVSGVPPDAFIPKDARPERTSKDLTDHLVELLDKTKGWNHRNKASLAENSRTQPKEQEKDIGASSPEARHSYQQC